MAQKRGWKSAETRLAEMSRRDESTTVRPTTRTPSQPEKSQRKERWQLVEADGDRTERVGGELGSAFCILQAVSWYYAMRWPAWERRGEKGREMER